MNVLIDPKIKRLFVEMLLCIVAFAGAGAALLCFAAAPALPVLLCGLGMAVALLLFCYRYFVEQRETMAAAVAQITACVAGNRDARIPCDREGELYRLFHEVNSLATVLNAHAENEQQAKLFLKDTLANISHQLKTPLAALNIYNGILQTEAENPQTVREFTALSEQELDRIETLVQNLLKIAKLDAGAVLYHKEPENLSDLMAEVGRHFAFRAEREEKQLVLAGDADATLVCDTAWLREAMDNLVKNALDHTKAGDKIAVSWRQYPALVQVRVEDNGCGIHPEDIYHIFKRFYRSEFSKDTQGVGLGLPLAKSIIEGHGGTIRVESTLGKGTTFVADFPIPTKL